MSKSLKIITMMCPPSKYGIKATYSMKPTRIVIHNTANTASAINEISYMNRNNNQVSFHYAVDETQAVQGIPLNRNAWHAGDGSGKGNREGIGIEICRSKSELSTYLAAEDNGAYLAAKLLVQYGWGMNKLTKHQDYSGKYCPHRGLDLGWNRFVKIVEKYYNEIKTGKPSGGTSAGGGVQKEVEAMDRDKTSSYLVSYTKNSENKLITSVINDYLLQGDKVTFQGAKSGTYDFSGMSNRVPINIGGKNVDLSSFSKIPKYQYFVMDEEDLKILLTGQKNWYKIRRIFENGKLIEDNYTKYKGK